MIGASIDLARLREEVRSALTMIRVATFDGLTLRLEQGGNLGKGKCPFHEDKSPSFICGGKFRDRCHCYGCGVDYDIFEYWQKRRSVDHAEAVRQLAGLAGVYFGEITFEKPKAGVKRSPGKRLVDDAASSVKPSLPSLYQAKREDCEAIAKARGLDAEAVWIAAANKRLAVVKEWPLYQSKHNGLWYAKQGWEQHRCWAAIDETRNVAEYRRIDNGLHTRVNQGPDDDKGPKVWSTGGKKWPLGAAQIGDRKRVLLVEGGPDMLAAYHFLRRWNSARRPLLHDVAVVCMLGAGLRMRDDAMAYFKGCRVRIMVDADQPKDSETKTKRKLVGLEAAHRWQTQLAEAGAAVELFYVGDLYNPDHVREWHEGERAAGEIEIVQEGLLKADGSKVKDLNDVVHCTEDVQWSDDIREAMCAWDF
ncbi:MAG: hypothetical protein E6Q97_29100 [Desulfurellales bacterium]|nr:MAG: hypothetical protein E6Q97_29100 [Desulfurellales bacterium]